MRGAACGRKSGHTATEAKKKKRRRKRGFYLITFPPRNYVALILSNVRMYIRREQTSIHTYTSMMCSLYIYDNQAILFGFALRHAFVEEERKNEVENDLKQHEYIQ